MDDRVELEIGGRKLIYDENPQLRIYYNQHKLQTEIYLTDSEGECTIMWCVSDIAETYPERIIMNCHGMGVVFEPDEGAGAA